jgi:hypothetical protein
MTRSKMRKAVAKAPRGLTAAEFEKVLERMPNGRTRQRVRERLQRAGVYRS